MGFGSSKQNSQQQAQSTSTSTNQSYPFLQTQLGGQVSNAGQGTGAIANLLGLNGSSAQNTGFDNFRNSSGYNFIQGEGMKGIEGSQAFKGLLNSGSALKAVSTYNTGLASNFLNSYLSSLMGLSNTGIQAGQVLSDAGKTASSQSTSTGVSSGNSMNFNLG